MIAHLKQTCTGLK